eukprot:Nk52_evm54s210 gene=Nk52_evmTU54s210
MSTRAFDYTPPSSSSPLQFHGYTIASGLEGWNLVRRGYIHLSAIGSSPFAMVSARLPQNSPHHMTVVYVQLFHVVDSAQGIVVKKQLNINSPRDILTYYRNVDAPLRIATPFGSTTHFYALLGLKLFGIGLATSGSSASSPVTLSFGSPSSIVGMWDRGEIDGAYVWNPVLSQLQQKDGVFLLGQGTIANYNPTNANYWVASRQFIRDNPEQVQHFVNTLEAADRHFKEGGQNRAKWGVGGEYFLKTVEINFGPDGKNSADYPFGSTDTFFESFRSVGLGSVEKQIEYLNAQTGFTETVNKTIEFLAEQKALVYFPPLHPFTTSKHIDLTFLNTIAATPVANRVQFGTADIDTSRSFTPLLRTSPASGDACSTASSPSLVATSSTKTLTVHGIVSSTRACRWIIEDAASSSSSWVQLTFSYFFLHTGTALRIFPGKHPNATADTTTDQLHLPVYQLKDFSAPSAPAVVQLPITIEAVLGSYDDQVVNGVGWVEYGKAHLQGFTMDYQLTTGVCTQDSDCNPATPYPFASSSSFYAVAGPDGKCVDGMCKCSNGFSGPQCQVSHVATYSEDFTIPFTSTKTSQAVAGTFRITPFKSFWTADVQAMEIAHEGYPPNFECVYRIGTGTSTTSASSASEPTLWGFQLDFAEIDIDLGFDFYTISSLQVNVTTGKHSLQQVATFPSTAYNASLNNVKETIHVKGQSILIKFASHSVGSRSGAAISYTPIYNPVPSAAKSEKEERTSSASSPSCIHGTLNADTGHCQCDLGYFGSNCFSTSCTSNSGTSVNELSGRIVSQREKYYSASSISCQWSISPMKAYTIPNSHSGRVAPLKGLQLTFRKLDMEPEVDLVVVKSVAANSNVNITGQFRTETPGCSADADCGVDGTCDLSQPIASALSGIALGQCRCPHDRLGPLCRSKQTVVIPGEHSFLLEGVFDLSNIYNAYIAGTKIGYEGFDIEWKPVYECPSDCSNGIGGKCELGQCQCYSGFHGVSCVSEDFICDDLMHQQQFTMFEQHSYVLESFYDEALVVIIIGVLIGIVTLAAISYMVIMWKRTGLYSQLDPVDSVHKTFSNIISLAVFVVETLFFLSIILEPDLSFFPRSTKNARVLLSVFSFDFKSVAFSYFWLIFLWLWLFYCIIYLARLAPSFIIGKYGRALQLLMKPSVFYLRVVGTLGIAPIVGNLLELFSCMFFPQYEMAFISDMCTERCFSPPHMTLLYISGISLILYIPLTLGMAHFWQDIIIHQVTHETRRVVIYFRRSYILLDQLVLLVLIYCKVFLKLYPYAFLAIAFTTFSTQLCFFYFCKGHIVNARWMNWAYLGQYIITLVVTGIVFVLHILNVEDSILPFVLIALVVILIVIVFYVRAYQRTHAKKAMEQISQDGTENKKPTVTEYVFGTRTNPHLDLQWPFYHPNNGFFIYEEEDEGKWDPMTENMQAMDLLVRELTTMTRKSTLLKKDSLKKSLLEFQQNDANLQTGHDSEQTTHTRDGDEEPQKRAVKSGGMSFTAMRACVQNVATDSEMRIFSEMRQMASLLWLQHFPKFKGEMSLQKRDEQLLKPTLFFAMNLFLHMITEAENILIEDKSTRMSNDNMDQMDKVEAKMYKATHTFLTMTALSASHCGLKLRGKELKAAVKLAGRRRASRKHSKVTSAAISPKLNTTSALNYVVSDAEAANPSYGAFPDAANGKEKIVPLDETCELEVDEFDSDDNGSCMSGISDGLDTIGLASQIEINSVIGDIDTAAASICSSSELEEQM